MSSLSDEEGIGAVPKQPPLSQTHPEIAAEAMFDPTTISAGSNKKMPWKCATHGHQWKATVAKRSREGTGCPVCSNQKVLIGFNDLQTTHPDLALEAVFDPTTISAGSNKRVPWKCSAHGHEWETTVAHRTRSKSGCPICSNRTAITGFNDLQTTHPELAAEAMFDPTTIVAGSRKKMSWRCTAYGHEWEAGVEKRTGGDKTGCPFCSNKRVLVGFNDLQTTHPDLAPEAMFDPTTISAGSNKKMPWKCAAHGHEWETQVASRTNVQKTGCPVCSNQKVLIGFNDLQTTHPDLALEAVFDPTTISAGSADKKLWKCITYGHEWVTRIVKRSREGTGCPVCANQIVLAGFNDLQTTHPDLALEAVFDPTTISAGSANKKLWKCITYGHEWVTSVAKRSREGTGCPTCCNQIVLAGFNDLQTTHPDLALEAVFDPTTISAGSNKKMPWKCTDYGHEWKATVSDRSGLNETGCPVCSNRKVLTGFNDLQTTHPDLALEAVFDPTIIVAGSNKKMPWKCAAQGHKWEAIVISRMLGRGCPVCADSGFNPGDPAWLYLAHHPEWRLQQIGITNHIEDRLKRHTSNSWEVLDVRGPMDGFLTQKWEASILRWLSSRNIARSSSGTSESPHFDNPNSGEAWQESDLKVTSLREIMDLVDADEH
jgi:hypothetical protein